MARVQRENEVPERDMNEAEITGADEAAASTTQDPSLAGATEEELSVFRTDQQAPESFGKALAQVVVATIILIGVLGLYLRHVRVQEEVFALLKSAQNIYLKDSRADLEKAATKVEEALSKDDGSEFGNSVGALIYARLFLEQGVADHGPRAKALCDEANDLDAPLAERYAACALLDAAESPAKTAEALKTLIKDQGVNAGPIFGALAFAQRQQGQPAEARANFIRAADIEGRNPNYLVWASRLYLEADDLRNAKSTLKRARDVNPDHLLARALEVRVLVADGAELQRAEKELNFLLGEPEDSLSPLVTEQIAVAQAELARAKGDIEGAKTAIASVSAPGAELQLVAGLIAAEASEPEAAAKITSAIDAFPYSARAFHLGALALAKGGQGDAAKALMTRWATELGASEAHSVAFARLLISLEDVEGAQTQLDSALEQNPKSAEALFLKGQLADQAGDAEAAYELYGKAVEARGSYSDALRALGMANLKQGKAEEALPQLLKALKGMKRAGASAEEMTGLRQEVAEALRGAGKRGWVNPWLKETAAFGG